MAGGPAMIRPILCTTSVVRQREEQENRAGKMQSYAADIDDAAEILRELSEVIAQAAASPQLPKLMTAEEAAAMLGIGKDIFIREVKAKRIRFILIGKRKKYIMSDLAAYIDQQRNSTPCPSTSRKAPRTTITTSNSKVFDITVRLASMTGKKR